MVGMFVLYTYIPTRICRVPREIVMVKVCLGRLVKVSRPNREDREGTYTTVVSLVDIKVYKQSTAFRVTEYQSVKWLVALRAPA